MKKNILLYILGCVSAAATLISCSDDDAPEYKNITLNTQQLVIDLDQTTEGNIQITAGNGVYEIALSDNTVAEAVLEGNNIKVTALKSGTTQLTVLDWAKKTTTAEILVKRVEDLVLDQSDIKLKIGTIDIIPIYTGNGGYTIQSSAESVAKATINESGEVAVEGIGIGTAVITVTDQKGKTATLDVKVIRPLIISQTEDIIYLSLIAGETYEFNILDGNGGYTLTRSSTLYVDMLQEDTKVTLNTKRAGKANTTITVTDQEDQSASFKILFVDNNAYLNSTGVMRYFINEDAMSSMSASAYGSITYSPVFLEILMAMKTSATSAYATGYALKFNGDLTVGSKGNGTWFKIAKGKIDEATAAPATDIRIDKIENGWHWVSFATEGKTERSYIVIKQS